VPCAPLQIHAEDSDGPFRHETLFCGPPMFGDFSIPSLLQWVAYHRYHAGMEHFILYDTGASPGGTGTWHPCYTVQYSNVQYITGHEFIAYHRHHAGMEHFIFYDTGERGPPPRPCRCIFGTYTGGSPWSNVLWVCRWAAVGVPLGGCGCAAGRPWVCRWASVGVPLVCRGCATGLPPPGVPRVCPGLCGAGSVTESFRRTLDPLVGEGLVTVQDFKEGLAVRRVGPEPGETGSFFPTLPPRETPSTVILRV